MIKAVVIDDEEHCINALLTDLEANCPEVKVLATASSGKEGILAIQKHKPELVFLDVSMPWMNGFEMLELISDIQFRVIFVTAYDQYAINALRVSAVDYLLKPIDGVDLQKAVGKVKTLVNHPPDSSLVDNLLTNMKLPDTKQKIAVPYREGYESIETENILYCEAEGAYTRMFFRGENRVLLISKSLGDIEDILPRIQFQRIHHSTIVNLSYITHFIKTDGGYVQMNNGKKLMVSKTRKDALFGKIGFEQQITLTWFLDYTNN